MATHHRPYQGYPYSNPHVNEVADSRVNPTPISPVTPPTPSWGPSGAGRYQGYPYTNPHVHDAPSIDAATASRWAHLPRKPLEARNNVIYVDMPEEGSSQVTRSPGASQSRDPPDKKTDIDENPVIYIDVPEGGCSDVTEPVEPEAEPEYVQETIFYNPFDNRRIDQEKDVESVRSSDSDSVSGAPGPARPAPGRPTPPNTLNLSSPGSSSGYGSAYTNTPGLPPSMSKEAYVYRQQSSDNFPLSPIPISEFPQPPPAYTEIESPRLDSPASVPVQSPVPPVASPVPVQEPPRTVVITPGSTDAAYRQRTDEPSPIGLPNPYRKVVYCHHCGLRVHTLVIRQTGTATHLVALSALCIGLFPLTIWVYCTDTCKNKNHYCPNCNNMIGYEVPILCQNMTFTK